MSIPIRLRIDYEKIKVCKLCAENIVNVLKTKYLDIKNGKISIDIVKLLCDDCWKFNVENGAITIELDPKIIRN